MSDNTYDNDATTNRSDLRGNEEPATRHDINEGATIGGVGGAIVGGVAGSMAGPVGTVVGAVIGAAAGGGASGAAVGAVDKHDNDYDEQVAKGQTGDTTATGYDSGAYVPVRDTDATLLDDDAITSADPRYRTTTSNI